MARFGPKKNRGVWSIPKGEVEPGEDLLAAHNRNGPGGWGGWMHGSVGGGPGVSGGWMMGGHGLGFGIAGLIWGFLSGAVRGRLTAWATTQW